MLTIPHQRTPESASPRGIGFKKKGGDQFTPKELKALISLVIEVGIKRSYSVDYVVEKINRLVRENPFSAKKLGLSADYGTIKRMVLQKMDSLAYRKSLNTGAKDPGVMNKDKEMLTYGPVDGQLVVDGISADDINQGDIGDCYFMAALSAVADANPRFLEESIIDQGNGTYSVRFFRNGKPVYVTVDKDLPTEKEKIHHTDGSITEGDDIPVYGSSTDKGELWVSIMEKAYAKMMGGYENIGNGGVVSEALVTLTGSRIVSHSYIGSLSSDGLYSELEKALKDGKSVAASTYSDGSKYTGTGLVARHAYTVLDVQEVGGKKYVVLRNPWGHDGEWGESNGLVPDGNNDGSFMMPIEDFQRLFTDIAITKDAPQPIKDMAVHNTRPWYVHGMRV
ncbi:MAG: hypothetical protein HY541_08150 [Deltaproteobacteria bacterium]|nr:hypothetical protein [Deltaproteobacteria bacterium]